jgi:hypothetical protein
MAQVRTDLVNLEQSGACSRHLHRTSRTHAGSKTMSHIACSTTALSEPERGSVWTRATVETSNFRDARHAFIAELFEVAA